MKKRGLLAILLLALALMTTCSAPDKDLGTRLEAPENKRPPLEGRWIMTGLVGPDPGQEEGQEALLDPPEDMTGKEAIFLVDLALVDGDLNRDISYRMRKIPADIYLDLAYNMTKEEADIKSENLFVITILDQDDPILEVLREKEDVAYINLGGYLVKMVKTGEDLSRDQVNHYLDQAQEDRTYRSKTLP